METFDKIKVLVRNNLLSYDISSFDVRVGLLAFGETVVDYLKPDDVSTKRLVLDLLQKMSTVGGSRNIDLLLKAVNDAVTGTNRNTLLILITTGNNPLHGQSNLKELASKALRNGVQILTIGIGPNIDRKELELISTGGTDGVIVVNSADMLPNILGDVENKIGLTAGNMCLRLFHI